MVEPPVFQTGALRVQVPSTVPCPMRQMGSHLPLKEKYGDRNPDRVPRSDVKLLDTSVQLRVRPRRTGRLGYSQRRSVLRAYLRMRCYGSIPVFQTGRAGSIPAIRTNALVAKWQTRQSQKLLSEGTWEFNSPRVHQPGLRSPKWQRRQV